MTAFISELFNRLLNAGFAGTAIRRCAAIAVLGAPFLGGCAATNVGNAWQCPLNQGEPCQSVALADPAAPDRVSPLGNPGSLIGLATETPLDPAAAANDAPRRSVTTCGGGCRPRSGVSRLFRNRAAASGHSGRGGVRSEHEQEAQVAVAADADASGAPAPQGTGIPQGTVAPQGIAAPQGPAARQGLRTSEVIGRIWIAPYIDAGGVYHEASWVRVVLQPAGWKHP